MEKKKRRRWIAGFLAVIMTITGVGIPLPFPSEASDIWPQKSTAPFYCLDGGKGWKKVDRYGMYKFDTMPSPLTETQAKRLFWAYPDNWSALKDAAKKFDPGLYAEIASTTSSANIVKYVKDDAGTKFAWVADNPEIEDRAIAAMEQASSVGLAAGKEAPDAIRGATSEDTAVPFQVLPFSDGPGALDTEFVLGKECAPMKGATSIQERLWELRKDKGLNLEELSKLTGISKSALGSYEKEDFKEINHGNLITLADFYGVSVDYLLCRTENREQINTPLTELHLNDEMVALLKSGRINNRLLCELATHKDFIKFLADIEIYVDGIATMQIQNLNTLVDTVRHEIIERYRPGEDDPHLKVLQAAHISDDEYFSHMVLDDLNLIIRDIRETHKKDSESAPQTTVANELKENLEAVENFKGSRLEKLAVLYCKQLGINYKNLSDEEFRWLIRILQKSKKTGTPINQRKKR